MLRYLRSLADKDYALDRGMIPLGSCTMKLNATTEMEPVTWPEFADMHPYAPADADRRATPSWSADLEGWLAEVTGYDAVSVQPNAGSQGELAGLLAIRAYHRANGDDRPRRVPDPVQRARHQRGQRGDGRHAGRRRRLRQRRQRRPGRPRPAHRRAPGPLAAIMVTYPSTHGVYETGIAAALRQGARRRRTGLCGRCQPQRAARVRQAGPVRRRRVAPEPAQDVLHPARRRRPRRRAGGGARTPRARTCRPTRWHVDGAAVGPVSAAQHGSAGILPIPWAYLRLMGPDGLARATGVAVLAANYVAARLRDHFPVLYAGNKGLVAHECILDLRPITKASGVTVDDVAKRLVDYGFHAPTMSFPVAGTLMVEPTESEDLTELDRFCDAMIEIRREIDKVAAGEWPAGDNPLANAPHTAEMVTADDVGARLPALGGGLPGRASTRRRSTGRRCVASTARTATATWSAPARRRRRSRTDAEAGPAAHARPPAAIGGGQVRVAIRRGDR